MVVECRGNWMLWGPCGIRWWTSNTLCRSGLDPQTTQIVSWCIKSFMAPMSSLKCFKYLSMLQERPGPVRSCERVRVVVCFSCKDTAGQEKFQSVTTQWGLQVVPSGKDWNHRNGTTKAEHPHSVWSCSCWFPIECEYWPLFAVNSQQHSTQLPRPRMIKWW